MIYTENVYMLAVVYSEDMSSWNEIQAEQEAEKAVL